MESSPSDPHHFPYELKSPVGLVAGNGNFPLEFLRAAKDLSLEVVVVAHRGETSPEVAALATKCLWIEIGELSKAISFFTEHRATGVAFLGGIIKRRLMWQAGGMLSLLWPRSPEAPRLRPDKRALSLLLRVGFRNDDSLLRAIAREFEKSGLPVFAPHILLPESVASQGVLTARSPTRAELHDALLGWQASERLGELDIGQTAVASGGTVVALEGVEGTDKTIARAGELTNGRAGVVVKLFKVTQDDRLDMPGVGVETIEEMKRAGATALVVRAGKTLFLHPQEVITRANGYNMAIAAYSERLQIASLSVDHS